MSDYRSGLAVDPDGIGQRTAERGKARDLRTAETGQTALLAWSQVDAESNGQTVLGEP